MPLCIDAIPAFQDNYIWLLYNVDASQAWVVDPGESAPVLSALSRIEKRYHRKLTLEGVLVTHHHADHDGGIPGLRQHFPALRVIGSISGSSPSLTERIPDKGRIELLGHTLEVMDVPGHTLDHIAFYDSAASVLFCGDTLFAAGCGRIFEGTASQMYQSLGRIAKLPPDTLIYCAHEYTLANLRFATKVEPGNALLQQRFIDAITRRKADLATVPSLLSQELATNPFLRCHEPSIMAAVHEQMGDTPEVVSPLNVFTVLRAWKDRY